MPKTTKQKNEKIKGVKTKKIKLKLTENEMSIILQNWLLNKKVSNLGLISLDVHRHIRKFVSGLKDIFLSEELQ